MNPQPACTMKQPLDTPPAPAAENPEELKRKLLEDAIQQSEKLAESALDMAKLFIAHGQKAIARRRLQEMIRTFERSKSTQEAKLLLKSL
ncbi:MAG: hypothetical protein JSS02_20665 [Planctomycetes bacterium]|nr:hypothetical protein [Planctomycetota bacterium]